MPVHILDGIMKLDMQPIQPWMKEAENIIFDESDEIYRLLGAVACLWGRSETFLLLIFFQQAKSAGDKTPYNPTRWGRARLLKKIEKFYEINGTAEDREVIRIMAGNLKVTQLVRSCVCHRRLIGVLRNPEKSLYYEGFDQQGKIVSYIITPEMVRGTLLDLNMALRYMQLYADYHYPNAVWSDGV